MVKKFMFLLISFFTITQVCAKQVSEQYSVLKQVNCLAEAIFFEARGEPESGQIAVANVILNRTDVHVFPSDVCKVISQKGQFQWYANKKLRKGRVFRPSENKDIMKLASTLYMSHIFGVREDSTNNSLFFSSNGVKPCKHTVRSIKVGRHQFYKFHHRYLTKVV